MGQGRKSSLFSIKQSKLCLELPFPLYRASCNLLYLFGGVGFPQDHLKVTKSLCIFRQQGGAYSLVIGTSWCMLSHYGDIISIVSTRTFAMLIDAIPLDSWISVAFVPHLEHRDLVSKPLIVPSSRM